MQGYDFAAYECGKPYMVVQELRNRGLTIRSSFGVGFKQGVTDYNNGLKRKYGNI